MSLVSTARPMTPVSTRCPMTVPTTNHPRCNGYVHDTALRKFLRTGACQFDGPLGRRARPSESSV
jgi:hypothetical protein